MTSLFVTCAPYLEPLLAEELQELGFSDISPSYRGVFVHAGQFEDIYTINYRSRLAARVLLPLERFTCRGRDSLYDRVRDIPWKDFFKRAKTFAVDANVDSQVFKSSLFAAQVVKDAVCDRLRDETGNRPNVKPYDPDLQLNFFLQQDRAVLSIDTSGSPLHKRGYRQEAGGAPLQETLAAALLKLANYTGDEIFLDPCCGSGTLLIEAALIASCTPPQFFRRSFGFMHLPEYDEVRWLGLKNEVNRLIKPLPTGHFFGVDINRNAVRMCHANLRAAGLMSAVRVIQSDFREFKPQVLPNFILTNPPYGNRLTEEPSLLGLYRALGDFMKQNTAKPARGFVFTGNLELSKEVGLAPKRRHVLQNGGIESRLLEFDLY